MVVVLPLAAGLAAVLLAGTRAPTIARASARRRTARWAGAVTVRWARARTGRRIHDAVPDVLEIVGLALGSGFDLVGTLDVVCECAPPGTVDLFDRVVADLRAGVPRRSALVGLAQRSDGAFGPMVEVLLAAERDGVPVAMVIDRLTVEATTRRRAIVHERARRTPVLLLAPLVLCSLPAVLLGTIVPLLVITLGQSPL